MGESPTTFFIMAYNELDNTFTSDIFGTLLEGQSSDVFTDWLYPGKKEQRQLNEQWVNDIVEPMMKLQGMRAAGINPLTASSGIAQQPSQAPQPSSSVNPLGDVADAVGSVASSFSSVSGAISSLFKINPEVSELRARAASEFAAAGLDNATTQGVLTDNYYKDDDWLASLNIKRQQYSNMCQEYSNLVATHHEINANIRKLISESELNGSLQDLNNAHKLYVDEEKRWLKELNDFRINNKLFILDSGIDGYIYNAIVNGFSLDDIDKFIEIYSRYRGSVQTAVSDASNESDLASAESRANAYARGQYNANPYFQEVREAADSVDLLYNQIEQCNNLIKAYDDAFKNGEISEVDYTREVHKIKKLIDSQNADIKKLNKFLSRQQSRFGYRSLFEDTVGDAVKLGLGAMLLKYGVFQGSPTSVRGFAGS